MKVAVGMSGGVDSSVAAIILKEKGYDVLGISMSTWDKKDKCSTAKKHSCYGPGEANDMEEAKKICDSINIPFHVIDCSDEYKKTVLRYFKEEYMLARTPNPCIVCNYRIKFGSLLEKALSSGVKFDKFATGHYAKTGYDKSSERYLIKRASDLKKDQSYFLYRLSQSQLSNILFPLGELTKESVRSIAREKGLAVSEREESQDFFGGNYRELLDVKDFEGDIMLTTGEVVGRHKGLWNYTPGQRRGLGIAFPEPLYVIRLDSKTNTVIAGTKKEVIFSAFIVNDLNWVAFEKPGASFNAQTKVRSSQSGCDSFVEIISDREVKVTLKDTGAAISPGQSAVFYSGDTLIGGGVIEREVLS